MLKVYPYFIFPSFVIETECENYSDIQQELIDWIYACKKKDIEDNGSDICSRASSRGGWQSLSESLDVQSFDSFRKYILEHSLKSLDCYQINFRLGNMWANINQKNDYNVSHCHPNALISGVFWVKTPENCGKLVFNNPNAFKEFDLLNLMLLEIKDQYHYHDTFEFKPQEGRLILFPAHLMHFVELNQSDEDRISIAFNLI